MRKGESVNMGKHDMMVSSAMSEALENHYKERISLLESQCRQMSRQLQAYEDSEEKLNGVIAELKDENEKLTRALGRVVAGV